MTDVQAEKLEGKVVTNTIVSSGPGSIDWRDVGRGALYAIAAGIIPLLQQSFSSGKFDFKAIGLTAGSALVGYLAIKLFQPARVTTIYKKPE